MTTTRSNTEPPAPPPIMYRVFGEPSVDCGSGVGVAKKTCRINIGFATFPDTYAHNMYSKTLNIVCYAFDQNTILPLYDVSFLKYKLILFEQYLTLNHTKHYSNLLDNWIVFSKNVNIHVLCVMTDYALPCRLHRTPWYPLAQTHTGLSRISLLQVAPLRQ